MNWFNKQIGRKYLYLLWSPFNGIWKVGITTKFDSRLANIRKTTGEVILPIFKAKIVNAKKVEQRILRHFKPWRVNWKGSGKTEWLRMPFCHTFFSAGIYLDAVQVADSFGSSWYFCVFKWLDRFRMRL